MRNTGIENSCVNEEENKVDDNKHLKYLWWGWLNNLEGLYLKEDCKWHTVTFPFQNKSSQGFQLTMIYVKLLELQTAPMVSLESNFVDSWNVCCLFKRWLWIFYAHETTTCNVLQLLQWHLLFTGGHLAVHRDYTYLMLTLSRSHNSHAELPSFPPAYLFVFLLIHNTVILKLLGSWIVFCWVTLSTVYKCLFVASL